MSDTGDPIETLRLLRANREAMSWPRRREFAAGLRSTLLDGGPTVEVVALIEFLAEDPQPEVRKETAELLVHLDDGDFAKLAAKLADDPSSFVRKAVERAMDRRRRGARDARRQRQNLENVQDQLNLIRRHHGDIAVKRAEGLADRQFALLVRQTVHDVRGILSPIKSDLAAHKAQLAAGASKEPLLEQVAKLTERVGLLERFIDDLAEYSSSVPTQRRRERLGDVVRNARSIVLDGIGAAADDVALDIDVADDLAADMTRHQVLTALVHILRNAFDAVTEVPPASRPKRIAISARRQGDDIDVSVADNGPGMCPEHLAEVIEFVPGRTTKKNRGTGFGLPTAFRCARAHGGDVIIESTEGSGTTVTFRITRESDEGME